MIRVPPHIIMFFFGFIYYLIAPYFIGKYGLIDSPSLVGWYSDFSLIPESKLNLYFFTILLWPILFFFPEMFFKNKALVYKSSFSFDYNNIMKIYLFFSILSIFIIAFLIFFQRSSFSGYSESDLSGKGSLASLITLILFFFILNLVIKKKKNFVLTVFNITFFILTLLLLLTGTRMYFLIVILAILIYKVWYADERWSFTKLVTFSTIFLFVILLIGIIRNGIGTEVTFERLKMVFFMEPIFTWWSNSFFLSANEFESLNYPLNYFSSYLNFIPSFLLPNKTDYMFRLESMTNFYAPLGAESIFVAIQANFGYLFGWLYFFFFGLYYSFIRSLSKESVFFKTYYICIVAFLPFQFFRDGFFIITKQITFTFLLFPFVIIFISNLFKKELNLER